MKTFDLDHVILDNGKIYRVLGNIDSDEYFLGYNVYSLNDDGDRIYQGKRYSKNFIEDERLPDDVFDTYEILPVSRIVRRYSPVESAKLNNLSFANSVWHDLYDRLVISFGIDNVGIFGSSMFNLHLTPDGAVRKDVDFVVDGLENVEKLREQLPYIREDLGFTSVGKERQLKQYERYQKVFHNKNNAILEIIERRWTGVQLSENVVSTIRFRDKNIHMPCRLVDNTVILKKNVIITGKVLDANSSNLFPRLFTLQNMDGDIPVFLFWWKFSTPVNDGDEVRLCGDLVDVDGAGVVRISNFREHWLQFSGD